MTNRHVFLTTTGVALTLTACHVIFGFDDVSVAEVAAGGSDGAQGGVGGSDGGDGGAGASAGAGGGSPCDSALPPDPPTAGAPGTPTDFVVAVRSIAFGEDDLEMGPTIGFDLDGACSCSVDERTCVSPQGGDGSCDGTRGQDNAIAALVSAFESISNEFSSTNSSLALEEGRHGLLFAVEGYNGGTDDQDVSVAVYLSPGTQHCGVMPSFDGADVYPLDDSTAMTGVGGAGGSGGSAACSGSPPGDLTPTFASETAYVSDSVLVAQFPAAEIPHLAFSDGFNAIHLDRVVMSARVVSTANGYALTEGVLGGRWSIPSMFSYIATLRINDDPLCRDSAYYNTVKTFGCGQADILIADAAPSAPCEALSFGIAFETAPASLGQVVGSQRVSTQCTVEQDPSTDDCSGG